MPSDTVRQIIDQFRVKRKPNYVPQGSEEELMRFAFRERVPLIIKGPTGCGKTRFIEHMAHALNLPLITVSCHEDLTAADLVGRFLLKGDETVWQDGPLTLAVRYGAICYWPPSIPTPSISLRWSTVCATGC